MATTVLPKTPAPTGRTDSPIALETNLRMATDDEILNLTPRALPKKRPGREVESDFDRQAPETNRDAASPASSNAASALTSADAITTASAESTAPLPQELQAALDEHPELRSAWEDVSAYRESFASPEEARQAKHMVSDLSRLDALFFSSRPEDHAELARTIAQLDRGAAASLAQALAQSSTESQRRGDTRGGNDQSNVARVSRPETSNAAPTPLASKEASYIAPDAQVAGHQAKLTSHESINSLSPAQTGFFHATNTAAVEGVLDAIHAQVDRLLPQGTSQGARNRVVGEVYRELDALLRANRQLNEQVRQAFRTGALDGAHQRAIVSLITSRARQALPGVAKRVLNEWTAALVSAGEERRTRQRAAETRVDIAGSGRSGSDGRRALSPREIDYSRLSDADILNL